ncbi:CHRD domain-containing protein [Plantactinospora endophytica]|uniref:CHRD domain-containing protein n=1 Tax=Plantactinospora endophytica TaxID=673535 RepID=A0ABQ4DXQ0_9ACTN|nr:CHRD domain-containing protein [Plantactinospora endophytica]GIG87240.1 CHRD domain-containing protein [Plantactinospora endophytica]
MMIRRWYGAVASVAALLAAGAGTVRIAYGTADRNDDERDRWGVVRERLTGYQEDPLAISTSGTGRLSLGIDEDEQELTYQLSYEGLEGNVTQAHVHVGGRAQSGGISAFICTNLGNGPAGTQACPAAPATVTGTIRPVDVIGPTAQGITAGQFDELVAAVRAGATYVNVHSSLYPGGEIRAQLGRHRH